MTSQRSGGECVALKSVNNLINKLNGLKCLNEAFLRVSYKYFMCICKFYLKNISGHFDSGSAALTSGFGFMVNRAGEIQHGTVSNLSPFSLKHCQGNAVSLYMCL